MFSPNSFFLTTRNSPNSTVLAINDPFLNLEYAAYQFKHDSVHGIYPQEVTVEDGCMVIGDVKVKFFSERNPEGKNAILLPCCVGIVARASKALM